MRQHTGGGRDDAGAPQSTCELAASYDRDARVLDFRGESSAGEVPDTEQLHGTPRVLAFNASWCPVCDRELPDCKRLSERLAGHVDVVGANPRSDGTTAQSRLS